MPVDQSRTPVEILNLTKNFGVTSSAVVHSVLRLLGGRFLDRRRRTASPARLRARRCDAVAQPDRQCGPLARMRGNLDEKRQGRADRTFRAGPAQQGAHSKGNHCAILLAIRIRDEERLLGKELGGCREYTQQVRYRLVPYVWQPFLNTERN